MEDKKPGANEKAGDLTRKSRTSVSEVSLYRRLRRCDETNGVADMAVKAFFFSEFFRFFASPRLSDAVLAPAGVLDTLGVFDMVESCFLFSAPGCHFLDLIR